VTQLRKLSIFGLFVDRATWILSKAYSYILKFLAIHSVIALTIVFSDSIVSAESLLTGAKL
jgi:hypothetical protein